MRKLPALDAVSYWRAGVVLRYRSAMGAGRSLLPLSGPRLMDSVLFGIGALLWVVVSTAVTLWLCPRLFRYAPRTDE